MDDAWKAKKSGRGIAPPLQDRDVSIESGQLGCHRVAVSGEENGRKRYKKVAQQFCCATFEKFGFCGILPGKYLLEVTVQ